GLVTGWGLSIKSGSTLHPIFWPNQEGVLQLAIHGNPPRSEESHREREPVEVETGTVETGTVELTPTNPLTVTLQLYPAFTILRHQESTCHVTESDLPPEKLKEMVDWLKINKYPVSEVETYMKETAMHRGKWIHSNGSKSIPEILNEFPRLVDNPGMILQDFQLLYPEAAGKLHENWAGISEKVLVYAQQEGKLSCTLDHMTPAVKIERALKILPALLPPSLYKSGGKLFRLSAEESRKSFIDVQPVGTIMVEYLKHSTQPFPHVLCLVDDDMAPCSDGQVFSIVAGNAIAADSLLGAVDHCFKMFFIFDLNYTRWCLPTWEFLQHSVYKIPGNESSVVTFFRTCIFSSHV
ncbi:hypothetical protein INR49_015105, partial [Caranx melampygus]